MISRRGFLGMIASLPFLKVPHLLAYSTDPTDSSRNVTDVPPKEKRTINHRDLTFTIAEHYQTLFPSSTVSQELTQNNLFLALANGSVIEDAYIAKDRFFRFVEHFYNPDRPAGKRGLKILEHAARANPALSFFSNDGSKDALSRAERLWDESLSFHRDGKLPEAYTTLGRVLHLLEDAATPEHVYLVDHGVYMRQVACSDSGGAVKFYDTESDVFKHIANTIKSEDIDWGQCVVVDKGSPYEKWCRENALEATLGERRREGASLKSLEDAFQRIASLSLHPDERIRTLFSKLYAIGAEGNGWYASEGTPEEWRALASSVVPPLIQYGAEVVELFRKTACGVGGGEELDLSRPENPVKYYFDALRDANFDRGHELYLKISQELELCDSKKWKKLRENFKLLDTSIEKPYEKNGRWIVPVVMVYEENGKRRIDKTPFEVVFVNEKYKLETK